VCFLSYPLDAIPALPGYVRLALEGPLLTSADAEAGLLLLDATWRLVAPIEAGFRHVPPRTLPPALTAYPRDSKLFQDPAGGLASIEALYLAHRILGRSLDLLAGYPYADFFVARNGWSVRKG
jgi:pre-rRNA-processing protein TSR3